MSTPPSPLSYTPETADAYVRALFDTLGNRDPLDTMARTPATLRDAVEAVPEAAIHQPEAPGKWSVGEVVQHLADAELIYAYRLRLTVAEDRPALQAIDQDLWAQNLRYRDVRLEDALADFEALRTLNLRFLRALPEEAWERVGLHAERGEESVRKLTRLLAGHDLVHLRQIERIKRVLGS